MRNILITGGAGFVGSYLARRFKAENPGARVVALDNLRRRGSELNLPELESLGIQFIHGDIRYEGDLQRLDGDFDLFIEASAEPSVLAGLDGSPAYAVQTNLGGTLNCLEFARKRAGQFVFLSTSRVYSIAPLRDATLREAPTRFELQDFPNGVEENFPTHLPRSIYGATKLASELLIQEYAATYGLKSVINRCGVIAGPGQFGKVDQGVFTLWVANHVYGKPLTYTGFGGAGKQVRDLLHPEDLYALISLQLSRSDRVSGEVFNVGGGPEISVSLLELTELCRKAVGREVPILSNPATTPVDIPVYISNNGKVERLLGWRPRIGIETIVSEIARWITDRREQLSRIF